MQQQEFVVSRDATLSLLTRTSVPGHLQNFTRLSQNDFPQNFARSSSQNPQAHPRKNFHTSTPNTEHLQDLHARAPQGTLFGWRCQRQFLAWSHPNFSWIATTLGFGTSMPTWQRKCEGLRHRLGGPYERYGAVNEGSVVLTCQGSTLKRYQPALAASRCSSSAWVMKIPGVFAAIAHCTPIEVRSSTEGDPTSLRVLEQQRGCRPHHELGMPNLASRDILWSSKLGHSAKKFHELAWGVWHHLQGVRTSIWSDPGR